MADAELLALQVAPEAPRPEEAATKTDMVLSPSRNADRLRHFPEEVYDLSAESHLVRFVKVLLGDAGAGQLRKRMLVHRMQSTLQGTHFYDLDRFYGPLFGVRRTQAEVLDFDPYTQTAITEKWDEALAKDASFRSRIEQFSRALTYGATPTGMELVAEALLAVDCDIYESYIQADDSYQTYAELEDQYGPGTPGGTYADMEGVSYATLEGEGLARMSGDERRVFTVRPKRRISLAEARDLRRVLDRVKPADSRFIIDYTGIAMHDPLPVGGVVSDSEHWEVISSVAAPPSAKNPYQIASGTPVEQPRPPFSGYQGEAWSYNADVIGTNAFYREGGMTGTREILPTQRITGPLGRSVDFPPQQAVLPRKAVQLGRVVSDGILVAHPYSGPRGVPAIYEDRYVVRRNGQDISRLYADGIPLDPLNTLLKGQTDADPYQQNPEHRYWLTAERYMADDAEEYLEVRLSGDRIVNYVSFEVVRFPHEVVAEVYDTASTTWVEVHREVIRESIPRTIQSGQQEVGAHPYHSAPGHWHRVGVRTPRVMGSRVRIRLRRVEGLAPTRPARSLGAGRVRETIEVPYSLAVRSLDFGYRVTDRNDFDFLDPDGDGILASTRDVAGSVTQFRVHEHKAGNLLGEEGYWRSEPQPLNYAVVNLYLDTRGEGDGTVIDRFFMDPTHVGPHFSIYYSNDPQETDGTDGFYEERAWTPIPRDYTLQKGYVHLPPTRARYWKFEFTNLVAEPYETFLPINRRVRLFPRALVNEMVYGSTESPVPEEMVPAIDVVRRSRYSDALSTLGVPSTEEEGPRDSTYRATESIYFPDPAQQSRLRQESWVFGFTPWHQGLQAPRFSEQGRHVYNEVEVRHASKVAFFVGLRSIEAYRTRWEADDDTHVYFDTFDDFRNLTPGFTWTFEPGYLTTGPTPQTTVEVTSRTFSSLHNIEAVQFATEQSTPVQLVPDHDFRDPALASYTWDNPDNFLRVGDAQLIYSPSEHKVLNLRYVVPPPKALDRTGGLVQEPVQPVFAERPFEVADDEAAAATEGGLASPLLGLSPAGRAYAAVRFTLDSDLTSPLILQIATDDGTVLAERELTGRRGETVEEYMPYDIPAAEMAVRVRLIQRGKSNDAWRVDSLALFEEGITWEFSVNGGSDWYPALSVRNNDNGVLTFPEVGNQLRFRARGYRPHMWVSAIKIRPWYVGTRNSRQGGTHRGPNLSTYDQDIPIHEDPMFTSWKKPVPYWWFSASKRYPLLPVEGTPNRNEFSRFYGRPMSEDLTTSDGVTHKVLQRRSAEERLDFFSPTSSAATRTGTFGRTATTSAPVATDEATAIPSIGISKPVTSTIVKPVFSERKPEDV